ncbi:hypothetical protein [Curtobacterium aetherium]|uniref:Uncharacterized protein n=1 Tax=Curtobacterium aetherium TaxID=2841594 RepID=A0ACD1E2G6_9MICO|nr:hypothetical protein [Curtobacterium sp. L6-1]QWS32807.1 hypothetical protein KM842_11055 [Curtobacterium sp. L6-1]
MGYTPLITGGGNAVVQSSFTVSWSTLGLAEGESTTLYVHNGHFDNVTHWNNSSAYRTVRVTRPRTFAASSSYDKAGDSFSISGKTVNSTSSIQVSDDGGSTWHAVGNASSYRYDLQVDRKYTSGTTIRVREGSSGSGWSISTHTAALTEVSLGKNGNKRTLTAKTSAYAEIHVSKSDVATDDYQVVKAGGDGWVRNIDLDQVPGTAKTATIWSGDRGKRTEVNLPLTLSANATAVDVERGTANLEGFVPDGTNLVQIKWGSTTKAVAPTAEGTFQYTLDKLDLGSNPVEITAYKGGVELGTFTLDVELKVEDITAKATFDLEDVEKTVQVEGAGTPGAKVEIRRGMKTISVGTVGADHQWTATVNPPNMTGVDTLEFVQVVRGQDNGSIELPVDYGLGTTITSPDEDFDLAPGSTLVMRGVSQQNSLLRVYEKGKPGTILGSTKADSDDGSWSIAIDDLEDREYELVVATTSKGYNVTTTERTINPGKSTVEQPTAAVQFDPDVTKKAVASGTGAEGATITVKNGSKTLGTTDVKNGAWSLPIDPVGPGQHTLTVEQTGIDGVQTTQTTADFGEAISLNAPTSFTGGKMTVTGKSSQGAQVAIVTGGKQVDSFIVTGADGSFRRDLTGLGSGKIELRATAKSKGALTTETTASSTAPVTAESVQLSSHVKNGTFVPGQQHFVGRGTVGATITLNPFGFDPKYAGYNLTARVDQFGEWAIDRGLSDTPYAMFSFKQTAQTGVTNEVVNYGLKPYRDLGQPGDLQLTNFASGDFFNPGDQVFAGKATPGATVVLNPFGFDPRYASYSMSTTADETTGEWQIRRGLGNTIYREVAVRQEPEAAGKVNKIEHISIAANGWVGQPADLTVTSHSDKGTFPPNTLQTFRGTATPGTEVTLYPFGTEYPTKAMTVTADTLGKWEIQRTLGNQVFPMVFTQDADDAGTKTARVDVRLVPTP